MAKYFKIVPKADVIPGLVKSADGNYNIIQALPDFAYEMESDMHHYFEAVEITEAEYKASQELVITEVADAEGEVAA